MRYHRNLTILCSFAGAMASGSILGCTATPSASTTVSLSEPSYGPFVGGPPNGAGVHTFLENQCGTLDCHGETGRPLRLYSVNGLRAPNDAGLVSGAGQETSAELYSNFLATISLEPEEMDRVIDGQDAPTALLLLRKPMGMETHKGGIRILEGDPMYTCLTSWLGAPSGQTTFDVEACTQAADLP